MIFIMLSSIDDDNYHTQYALLPKSPNLWFSAEVWLMH